jgi:hypothetical protein
MASSYPWQKAQVIVSEGVGNLLRVVCISASFFNGSSVSLCLENCRFGCCLK